jgi:hypothetical protein
LASEAYFGVDAIGSNFVALLTLIAVRNHPVVGGQQSGTAATGPAAAQGVDTLTSGFQERLSKLPSLFARRDGIKVCPLGHNGVIFYRHGLPPIL